MSPALLDDLVRAAVREVLAARGLDAVAVDPGVGRPRDPAQGEYATAVALRALAPQLGALTEAERHLLGDWLDRVID